MNFSHKIFVILLIFECATAKKRLENHKISAPFAHLSQNEKPLARPSINVTLIDCKPSEICVESSTSLLGNELGYVKKDTYTYLIGIFSQNWFDLVGEKIVLVIEKDF